MIRNILTNDGMQPVEVLSTFEVFGIKLFTYRNDDFNEYRVAEITSGRTLACGDSESDAIKCAMAVIHNSGEARMNKAITAAIAIGGVANKEAQQ